MSRDVCHQSETTCTYFHYWRNFHFKLRVVVHYKSRTQFFILNKFYLNISVFLKIKRSYLLEVCRIFRSLCSLYRNDKKKLGTSTCPKRRWTSAWLQGISSLKTTIFSYHRSSFKSNIYFEQISVENEVFKTVKYNVDLFLTMLNCIP